MPSPENTPCQSLVVDGAASSDLEDAGNYTLFSSGQTPATTVPLEGLTPGEVEWHVWQPKRQYAGLRHRARRLVSVDFRRHRSRQLAEPSVPDAVRRAVSVLMRRGRPLRASLRRATTTLTIGVVTLAYPQGADN